MLKGRKKEKTLLVEIVTISQKNTRNGLTLPSAEEDYGHGGKEPISFKFVNNGKVQFMCYKSKEITRSIKIVNSTL